MCVHISPAAIAGAVGSLVSLLGFFYLSAGTLSLYGLKPVIAKILANPDKCFFTTLFIKAGCIVLKPFKVIPEPGTPESSVINLSVSGQPDYAASRRILIGAGLTAIGALLQIAARFI